MSDVMWSIAQIALRDGISKAAVSKAVKRMLEEWTSAPVERGAQGQVLGISLAHYDEFRQRFVNPAKASAPIRSDNVAGAGNLAPRIEDSFEEARRQAEWLKVGREKIRHQEECGQLLRKDETERAIAMIAIELQSIVRRLPNRADEIALAVSKEGVHGVRVLLRKIAFELGNQMADRIGEIADAAPETDELIEDEEE